MSRSRESAAIEFDDQAAWGAYRPGPIIGVPLGIAHRLPYLLKPLTKILRRPAKYLARTPLDLVIWGLKLRLLPRGNLSEQKFYTAPQLFDPDEFAVLARVLATGGVFVDVGANAGIYSYWATQCMTKGGRILAVEPDPEMRRRMAFNIATNDLHQIEICALALSDHDGEAVLQVNPAQRGTNTLDTDEANRAGGAREMLTVPVTTLLALLTERGIGHLDVLKIDIEGHEPPVLRHFLTHAPEALWPRAVISEFKEQTASDILRLLVDCGYKCRKSNKLNFIFERG